MNWQGRRVLVTGAGGFIGSHLVEHLVAEGAQTRALIRYTSGGSRGWLEESTARKNIEFAFGDLRDRDSFRHAMKGVDIVFHLGALIAIPYSYDAPLSYVETNVVGTLNVLEAARTAGVGRVVHISTSETYGTARYVPIDETHPLQGQSPYSASKIGADMLAQSYGYSFGQEVVIIRPFNTFGPRQSTRAVIPTIISQALACDRIRLGNLSPTRDLTFVSDTVLGILAIGSCDDAVGRTVNLGSGQEISVGDLTKLICRMIGREVPILTDAERIRPENSEVQRLVSNNALARELANWTPRTSFHDGLAATIAWIMRHLERYNFGQYTK
ncbi:MAG: SDR family NAD(P)-dependent oxidoreductase [Alphaproteobacteria bacterium]|nr:SDR family NAD(P)-dependent oxidoreductase [Alphaproteobacteria bacterium]